jgi:hypothetical protein
MACPYSQTVYDWSTAGQGYAQFAGLLAGFSLAAMILMADIGRQSWRSRSTDHELRMPDTRSPASKTLSPSSDGEALGDGVVPDSSGMRPDTQRSLFAGLMALILAALLYSNGASEATQQSSGYAPPLILLASLVLVCGVFTVLHGLVLLLLQGDPIGAMPIIGIVAWGAPTLATGLIALLTLRVLERSECKMFGPGSMPVLVVLALVLVVSMGVFLYLCRDHIAGKWVATLGLVCGTIGIFTLTLFTALVGEFRWRMPTLLILSAPLFTAATTVVFAVDVKRRVGAAAITLDAYLRPTDWRKRAWRG